MANQIDTLKQHKAAKVAGISYLLVLLVPMIPMVLIDPKITVSGDTLATLKNIYSNQLLFNINNAVSLLMFTGVVVLALALYQLLKPVNKQLAQLGLVWRLIEAIVGVIAVLCSLFALKLLNGNNFTTIFGEEQLYTLAGFFLDSYWTVTVVVFVFLALGSMICFYLFLNSKLIPRIISIWGLISYSLVLIGAFISILFSNDAYMWLGSQTILFEVFIGLWLTIKGVNLEGFEKERP